MKLKRTSNYYCKQKYKKTSAWVFMYAPNMENTINFYYLDALSFYSEILKELLTNN